MIKVIQGSWDDISETSEGVLATRNYNHKELTTVGKNKIYLGRDKAQGYKCLMFMAKEEFVKEKDKPFAETEGLEIRFDIFRNEENKTGVILKLTKEDFSEVFLALTNNVLEVVEGIEEEDKFADAFYNQLVIWKQFLKNSGKKGLSKEAQRGLFGELYFIKNVLLPEYGNDGLKYWTGPNMAVHDFEIGNGAVEVKTSAGNKAHSIAISNGRQLDDEGYEKLFVYHVAMTVRKNSNPTLIDAINEVREELREDHHNLIQFNNLLRVMGFDDMHADYYVSDGFHISEVNHFLVKDGFPRILDRELVDGVANIKYKLEISACQDFKVEEDEFNTYLQLIK